MEIKNEQSKDTLATSIGHKTNKAIKHRIENTRKVSNTDLTTIGGDHKGSRK